ncbi:helix-turn-helix domain-containing protein, partial [Bdellovibrionota bacterium FG-2]
MEHLLATPFCDPYHFSELAMFRIGTGVAFMKRMTNLQSTADFLNMIEAAEFLRVKISTLYAWVHRRIIPHRKHGGSLCFAPLNDVKSHQNRRVHS